MNAPDKFAQLLTLTREPFPGSTKTYLEGSRPDLRVPVRDIALTNGAQASVYDTSGPYTDPQAQIDVRRGLPAGADRRLARARRRRTAVELGRLSGAARGTAAPRFAGRPQPAQHQHGDHRRRPAARRKPGPEHGLSRFKLATLPRAGAP